MLDADKLRDLISDSSSYSKEDYYDAFLDVTEKYLNELMSTLAYENKIIEELGDDRADEFMEAVAEETASKFYERVDIEEAGKIQRIKSLIDFIEDEFDEIGGDD